MKMGVRAGDESGRIPETADDQMLTWLVSTAHFSFHLSARVTGVSPPPGPAMVSPGGPIPGPRIDRCVCRWARLRPDFTVDPSFRSPLVPGQFVDALALDLNHRLLIAGGRFDTDEVQSGVLRFGL